MPSPEDGIFDPNGDISTTFYNAETGETWVNEVSTPSGLDFGEGGIEDQPFSGPLTWEETTEGFGTMVAAGSLSTFPRSANVKLIMRFTDVNGGTRWFACSGSMQDPGVVLTAGHCVYARTATGPDIFDWADEVYVYPAWDGVTGGVFSPPGGSDVIQNFGWARGTSFLAGSAWINSGNFDRDAGLIRLSSCDREGIGMLTSWFGWSWGGSCTHASHNNFSYPAENCPTPGLHTGRTMYFWGGSFDVCPGNQMTLNSTGGNCLDTVWGGMSGSGTYHFSGGNRFVHGVASTSNRNDIGNYCMLWEQFVTDMQAFENTTRGTGFDLIPLRVRSTGTTTVAAGEALPGFTVQMINPTNNNPVSQSYTLTVRLSGNNNISTGDTLLATWTYNSVNFGATSNITFNIPAPVIPTNTTPGSYNIGIILNTGAGGDINSCNNDTDTWDAQPITVTPCIPLPPADDVAPLTGATGVPVTQPFIDWSFVSGRDHYEVYFGTDSTPDAGELVDGNNTAGFWNIPGGTLNFNTNYYWRVDIADDCAVTTGPVWNFRTETGPDLTALLSDAPSGTYFQGQDISGLIHRHQNIGTSTSDSYGLEFRASTNSIISTFDTLMETRNYGGLNSGSSRTVSSIVQIPPTLTPGDYFIGIILYPNGPDASTGNNWVSDTATITVVACIADMTGSSNPNSPDYGVPDGIIDANDFFYFLDQFSAGNLAVADLTGSADPNNPAYGVPDGVIDASDFFFFLTQFANGCNL